MERLDLTLGTIEENLALDEALLLQAEAGEAGEVLRLWEWPSLAVVLGTGCKLHEDVDVEACRAENVPIQRRSSGGGTVLLDTGCLCYSLVLAFDRDPALTEIRSSYVVILGQILDGFGLPGASVRGISDLAQNGCKFSGNAQQRKRRHLLHHGTILYNFDLPSVARYLRQPARQPDYRADRPHQDFLRNLAKPREWLIERLCATWQADAARTDLPFDRISTLVSEKYSRTSWIERR